MKSNSKNFFLCLCLALGSAGFAATVQAEEICRACPFDCEGIGARGRDCENLRWQNGLCCVDLNERGFDQLRRKDRQNSRGQFSPNRGGDPGAYDDRTGYRPGDCPAGYHVNERNCNSDERRRGCSDMRSPSGQICVGWNQR